MSSLGVTRRLCGSQPTARGDLDIQTDSLTRSRLAVAAAIVVGAVLIVLAVIYWIEPASSLPGFIPGHEAGSGHHHVKHGIAAFAVGVALLVFAWFQTGKPRSAAA